MNYRLCVDIDGDGVDFNVGDSGPVYISTVRRVSPKVLTVSSVQRISFECSTCSFATTVHLAASCELASSYPGPDEGVITSPTERTPAVTLIRIDSSGSAQKWEADIDTRAISEGVSYFLCVDIDGPGDGMPDGNSGLSIFISPVQSIFARSIYRSANQQISLLCRKCSSGLTTTWLADSCTTVLGVSLVPTLRSSAGTQPFEMLDDVPSQGGDRRKVVLDASWLILGKRYQLCVDLDGASSAFSAGPVAEITVTPITQVKPVAIR